MAEFLGVSLDMLRADAFQVHKFASKINYNKLNNYFDSPGIISDKDRLYSMSNNRKPTEVDVKMYVLNTLRAVNRLSNTLPEHTQKAENYIREQYNKIRTIYSGRIEFTKLNDEINIPVPFLNAVLNALAFLKGQPKTFQKEYMKVFVYDCLHAYDGEDGLTCPKGVLERIIISLISGCLTDESNEIYKHLIQLVNNNISIEIEEEIKTWYKSHKFGTINAFDIDVKRTERRDNLKQYLTNTFRAKYGNRYENENMEADIDVSIEKVADEIGYDDDAFDVQYGGIKQKRKNRKNRKNRKTKTRRKPRNLRKLKKTKKSGSQ